MGIIKKVMKFFDMEKKDCILNSRNRDCRENYDKTTYRPKIGQCDALTKMLCKENGNCGFYKSTKEWIRVPNCITPSSIREYPHLFKLEKVR